MRHILEYPVKGNQQIPESFPFIQVSGTDEGEMLLFLRLMEAELEGARIYKVRYNRHFIQVVDIRVEASFQFCADADNLSCFAV